MKNAWAGFADTFGIRKTRPSSSTKPQASASGDFLAIPARVSCVSIGNGDSIALGPYLFFFLPRLRLRRLSLPVPRLAFPLAITLPTSLRLCHQ